MGHTFGEIKMTSHCVIVMFALMSSCLATAGKQHNTNCMFIMFFWVYFSSVQKNLEYVIFMQSLSIYILQGIKYLTPLQIHNVFAYIISYYTAKLLSCFSRVRLCATPQTVAHQAPPSLGFSGLPFPSPVQESEK